VVTKFGIHHKERDRGRDSRRSEALAAIERSLKFLNTDYVDVYLVHWPDYQTPFEETMAALEEIVQSGKARFVGVSNFSRPQLEASMAARRVDVGQYGYHLFDRRMEREIFPYCLENGVGVMAYGSLAHGLLAGAFTPETTFAESDWRSKGGLFGLKLFAKENFATNLAVVEELKALAARRGKTVAHLAFQWVLSNPAVSVGLIGFRTPAEVEASVGGLSWSLSGEERAEIDAIFARHGVDAAPPVWLEA
jgi:aryl-alcohol dehydrogenase-like predicted oxidoreductase